MSGGIACAGTFIVDRVKVVDRYPSESTVAMILDEKESNGGCAFNVLLNLARIDPELPLFAVGMIGDDLDAQKVMSMCSRYPGIDLTGLVRTRRASTSYTDVISARSNGSRTFFHRSGANALFSPEAVDLERLEVSLLHLGYLLVLDAMDAPDAKYGRVSARFLHDVQARGVRTSIDLVSAENADFPGIVNPALAFTDYCIVNEFEAQQLTDELAVIHFPEGAVALSANGTELLQPSLAVPAEQIVGATGAGDAFCAGVLYGCYQGWSLEQTMLLGACAGAQCLRGLAASDAIGAWQTALALVDRYGFRGELG
jgi:sugar/nucleoside kinase (ribokinase family)